MTIQGWLLILVFVGVVGRADQIPDVAVLDWTFTFGVGERAGRKRARRERK